MKKLWKWAGVLGAAALVGCPRWRRLPAGAAPSGYGFDNTPHVIVGGGSDTTYRAQISLSDLYNYSTGCTTTTAVGADARPVRRRARTPTSLGNHQHDTVAQANPVGSGAGIASLNGFTRPASPTSRTRARSTRLPGYLGAHDATGSERRLRPVVAWSEDHAAAA